MATAEDIYARFKNLPGSEYIASENAIGGLIAILRRSRPRRVLEMGSGIGTLTYAIIAKMDEVRPEGYGLVMVESHEFCREQLSNNLGDMIHRGRLVRDTDEIPAGEFDLIVVDGTFDGRCLRFLAPRGMVFVEGHRETQRQIIEGAGRPYCRALYRSMQMETAAPHHLRKNQGTVRWSGGYWVYQFHPTGIEGLRCAFDHFWNGLLVTKRRRLKLARLALGEKLGRLSVRCLGTTAPFIQVVSRIRGAVSPTPNSSTR